ncbi:NmrA family transcriptional regulator [Streptomyces sp. Rer75]|uniref:NmrA family transcriptional regulator n=1 Tax=Streptomyces sp. Rer75 TaxID=2750011 RepID=UPI0015D0087D|nr:NmrA family transcriptional regulator [Streptomyces sp. Rer75]QLH20801.1 NmrA family transcriptional regulator [Streptomyces sp. Rer75]
MTTTQHTTTQQTQHTTTLVLGGTGKTGRRIAERLTAAGRPVRIGSRGGEPPFDWEDRTTWAPALHGTGAAYLAYYPDIADPGAADTLRAFAEQAVRGGTRRLVLLSARGMEATLPAERAVAVDGAEWTVIRASWFFQNFSEGILRDGVLGGEIAFPAGDVKEPFIDADDIAEVAVAALTGDGPAGRIHDLTGPRLLTFAEVAAEIARASGRAVRYVPVSAAEYGALLSGYGLSGDLVAFLTELFGALLDGRNARVTDGVHRALGREPRDIADVAREAAADGAWA